MTASELLRKLAKLGCTFQHGTRHIVVHYRRKRALIPRHPTNEIKKGTYYGILRQLGIKE